MKTFILCHYSIFSNKSQTRYDLGKFEDMTNQSTRSHDTDIRSIFRKQRVVHLMNSYKVNVRLYYRKIGYVHEDNFK